MLITICSITIIILSYFVYIIYKDNKDFYKDADNTAKELETVNDYYEGCKLINKLKRKCFCELQNEKIEKLNIFLKNKFQINNN